MNESAMSELVKLKSPLGKRLSPGTDLLSGEHVLSHEVLSLLENSPTLGCLREQDIFSGTSDTAGKENTSSLKNPNGKSSDIWMGNLLLVKSVGGIHLFPALQ